MIAILRSFLLFGSLFVFCYILVIAHIFLLFDKFLLDCRHCEFLHVVFWILLDSFYLGLNLSGMQLSYLKSV